MQQYEDSITRPRRPASDGSAAMFVSLYVVLLAFFIVLNSMSREDIRRRLYVLDSVREAFDMKIAVDAPSLKVDIGVEVSLAHVYGRLRETVREVLAISELKVAQTGQTLQIEVPERKLFRSQSAVLLAEGLPLMQRMAAELNGEAGSRMDIRILAPHPAETEAWQRERLAKLAGMLADQGLAPARLSIGYAEIPGGFIRFEFLPLLEGAAQ